MANKTIRMRMNIQHLYELIDEVLSNSRSKIVNENRISISVGMEILASYLKQIAERAIELNDELLIELLLDLHVLKEDKEDG